MCWHHPFLFSGRVPTHSDLTTTDREIWVVVGVDLEFSRQNRRRKSQKVAVVQRLSRLTGASSCHNLFKHGMNVILTDSVLCGTEATGALAILAT